MMIATLSVIQKASPFDDYHPFWNLDFGWPMLLVFAAAILVLTTGIRFWARAKNQRLVRREALAHGFSLLAAISIGFLVHHIMEWSLMRSILKGDISINYEEAGDRMCIARQDIVSSAVVLLGALIGGAATFRVVGNEKAKPKPEQDGGGQPATRSESK